MGVERVVSTRVSLICTGWLPQDGTFESEWFACPEIKRDQLQDNVIAHSRFAGHSQTRLNYQGSVGVAGDPPPFSRRHDAPTRAQGD